MKENTRALIKKKLNIEYELELKDHIFFYTDDPYVNGPSSIQVNHFKDDNTFYLVGQKTLYSENELVRVLNLLVFA